MEFIIGIIVLVLIIAFWKVIVGIIGLALIIGIGYVIHRLFGWWGVGGYFVFLCVIGAANGNKTSSASASEKLPSPNAHLDKTSTTSASESQPSPRIEAQARPVDINTALGLPNDFGSDGQAQERPVDINTADREALLALPGIGVAEAGLILKRTQSGQGFGDLEELADYLSLKPHKTSRLRGKVRFSSQPRGKISPDDKAKAPQKRRFFGRVID